MPRKRVATQKESRTHQRVVVFMYGKGKGVVGHGCDGFQWSLANGQYV